MANLKIFVSSTCYDLNIVRSQLRSFITDFGYEPVMSDYADVLFDFRKHTHTSCIQEVSNCDMMIIIIGSRFGGKAIPKALELVDLEFLKTISSSKEAIDNKNNISITQLEVLKAIEFGLPIFTFVDSGVLHDHLVYEKNKDKGIIDSLDFPSIEKQETAKYIFEFINFLRHMIENNSITEFSKMEDIESFLQKQWSGLFQRLLNEQKYKKAEESKMEYLVNEIADIKTAIMTSITSTDLKETAKASIKYRYLLQFLSSLGNKNLIRDLHSNISWDELLKKSKIVEIKPTSGQSMIPRTALILEDGTYYEARITFNRITNDFKTHWEQFILLNKESKNAIIDAILDNNESRPLIVRYFSEPYIDPENESDVKDTKKGKKEVAVSRENTK